MNVQNPNFSLIAPYPSTVTRNERPASSDAQSSEGRSRVAEQSSANPVTDAERYEKRLAALKTLDANQPDRNATQSDRSNNAAVRQALDQYQQTSDLKEESTRTEIQLLFGIDVIA